ncbi:MAG: hypothetical protein WCF12_02725 [Propionicimonas sp.]
MTTTHTEQPRALARYLTDGVAYLGEEVERLRAAMAGDDAVEVARSLATIASVAGPMNHAADPAGIVCARITHQDGRFILKGSEASRSYTSSDDALVAARGLLSTARRLALAEQAPGGVRHDHGDAPGLDFTDCAGCQQRNRARRVLAEIDGGR